MRIALFDQDDIRQNLLPFTYTRPVAEIRVGILKISEKWEKYGFDICFKTQPHLEQKYNPATAGLSVNGALCPNGDLVDAIKNLTEGETLTAGDIVLASKGVGSSQVPFNQNFLLIEHPWEVFQHNGDEIRNDYQLITDGRVSEPIRDEMSVIYGKENIFIEEGVSIKAVIMNAEDGPIYIGKNAVIHEGSIIRGPFALGKHSHVNIGAKIRGDTTVGPFSKVGGEVSNSVIFGYSNKAHEGYLGNSVIGEWCNLGADTNTSNLKNNYASVKVWSYGEERFADTGLQFCGLMMADHAKCGINTMFNTGTVIGVGANIFGAGFPRNFIPSFSWGGAAGFSTFQLRKFHETATAVLKRKPREFDDVEKGIVDHVFEQSAKYRIWDKK